MTLEELANKLVLILQVHPEAGQAVIHTLATHKGEVVRGVKYSTRHKPPRIILDFK